MGGKICPVSIFLALSEWHGGGHVGDNGDPQFLPHLTFSLLSNALPSVWVRLRSGRELVGHSLAHPRPEAMPQAGESCQRVGQSSYPPCSMGVCRLPSWKRYGGFGCC